MATKPAKTSTKPAKTSTKATGVDTAERILQRELAAIAQRHLGIETLESRGLDALDFHDVGVASLADALKAAYELGRADAMKGK